MGNMKHPFTHTSTNDLRSAVANGARCGKRLGNRGFTMTELLAVIAIIAIMGAFAFVSISQTQKTMQQQELDHTAREIFVAAQNHLTAANAKGFFNRDDSTKGEQDSTNADIHYYVVGNSGDGAANRAILNRTDSNYTKSALYQMLPFGSIDDTVRLQGTYIIQYDAKSATVLNVFYARSDASALFAANTNGFSFANSDYAALIPKYVGSDKAASRQDYNGVMIGWYGGDDISTYDGTLKNPVLEVQNNERLVAVVKDENWDIDASVKPSLKLVIEGETSKASKVISLVDSGNRSASTLLDYVEYRDLDHKFYVFLDDITRNGGHFVDIFGPDGFIPGENLVIHAVAYSTEQLSNVAESGKAYRNSLFASLVAGQQDPVTKKTPFTKAKVANIRHLENLSENVSGFNPTATAWGGLAPTTATQTSDMSWTDFQTKIVATQSPAPGTATVNVLERSSQSSTQAATPIDGSFMPITPASGFSLKYEGRQTPTSDVHRISNVVVNKPTGNVGLFGDVANLTVSDVVLANFNVKTASGNAGALLGSGTGTTTITNVVAYNRAADDGTYGRASSEASLEVSGTGNVGGLVGSMQGGTVSQSAAALYVRSSNGPAGGLVGAITGEGGATITQSYSGGHTYSDTDDSDGETDFGTYLTSVYNGTGDMTAGRINVYSATGAAGGLVGSATNLTANASYSTCSAKGATNAGGFAGTLTNGKVSNCYATGLAVVDAAAADGTVSTDATRAGSFAGSLTGNVSGSYYLDVVNFNQTTQEGTKVEGVAGETPSDPAGLTAIDADLTSYRAFMGSIAQDGTVTSNPYDKALQTVYGTKFPYKTIAALANLQGTTLPSQLTIHYGDWPSPETLVVNEGGSGGGEGGSGGGEGGDDGPRDVVVVGGTDDLEAGDYFDLQLTSSSGRTFSLNKDFSWGFDVTSNPNIVVFDRNTNDVGLYFTESGTTTITLTAKEDLYKDGVMYFQRGTTMQITVTGLVRDLRGSYSDLARTYSQNGVQHYSVTFTNNTSRKVKAIVVRMKADGNITEIGGNVTGVVSDGYATITFDNYGNGISAGVTKKSIQMIVKGEGDFGLS